MIGTYKELVKYLECVDPYLLNIYNDFHNRPDPKVGDMYRYDIDKHAIPIDMSFVKIEFDSKFKNGVAFWYIFDNNGTEFKVWSINDVYDPSKLTKKERTAVYAFWKYCLPIT